MMVVSQGVESAAKSQNLKFALSFVPLCAFFGADVGSGVRMVRSHIGSTLRSDIPGCLPSANLAAQLKQHPLFSLLSSLFSL